MDTKKKKGKPTILQPKLRQVMMEKRMSTRMVADKIGVAHTTIVRALRGDLVDVATIRKLSKWMGVKPSTLIDAMAAEEDNLPDQIAIMLAQNPTLTAQFRKAVAGIVEGRVDASVIDDIAAYAAYRINSRVVHD